jgi:hypothetical protein
MMRVTYNLAEHENTRVVCQVTKPATRRMRTPYAECGHRSLAQRMA